jgi:hypothetical protein
MKKVFAIFILFGLLLILSFSIEGDKIRWDTSYKLKWTDYKASPYQESDVSAVSTISINYQLIREELDLKLIIYAEFIKDKSWVRTEAKNKPSLLKHEQGHFDVYEIFARKIRSEIISSDLSKNNYKDEINLLYDSLVDLCAITNQQYDKESMLSMDSIGQAKWDMFFANELNKLSDFSNPIISIKLQ